VEGGDSFLDVSDFFRILHSSILPGNFHALRQTFKSSTSLSMQILTYKRRQQSGTDKGQTVLHLIKRLPIRTPVVVTFKMKFYMICLSTPSVRYPCATASHLPSYLAKG